MPLFTALLVGGFPAAGVAWAQQPEEGMLAGTGSPSPPPVVETVPPSHSGLSFFLGAGGAKRKIYCVGCSQGLGFTVLANVSRFLTPKTAIGVEGTGWFRSDGSTTASLWSAMGAVTAWLTDQAPVFISGGLGLVGYHQSDDTYGSSGGTGFGCGGRIGYDAHISQAVAVVPYLGYVSTFGQVQVGRTGRVVSNIQFGLGVRLR